MSLQHFLRLTDFLRDDLLAILDLASDLKARQARGEPLLAARAGSTRGRPGPAHRKKPTIRYRGDRKNAATLNVGTYCTSPSPPTSSRQDCGQDAES